MKRLIPFLAAFTLAVSSSPGQIASVMPFDTSSRWKVNWTPAPPHPTTCKIWTEVLYYINGDSVYNNITYSKLYNKQNHFQQGSGDCNQSGSSPAAFTGLIRSEAGKVYFIDRQSNIQSEVLLYDFNLKVKDTVRNTSIAPNEAMPALIVSSIDTVIISGIKRRRFNLSSSISGYSKWIIEGIGHERGLLESMVHSELSSKLLCYKDRFSTYPENIDCSLPLGISEKRTRTSGISLHPNPAKEKVFLKFNQATEGVYSMQIINTIGQTVATIDARLYSEQQTEIALPALPQGLYFVNIYKEGEPAGSEKIRIE